MTRIDAIVRAAAIAAAAAMVPALSSAQVRRLTLDQAVEMAKRANPAVIQAEGDLAVAGAARREYYGDWLPTINSSGSWSANSTSRFDENTQRTVQGPSSTSYSAGLNASYTIFDGFRRNATSRSTGAGLESAEATLVNQEFQVVLQTKQAFYNAQAADELVRVARTRIERAESQLRISRDKLAAGSAIRSDTLQSFVELGNARLQLLNAETQRATAVANLARLVSIDGPVEIIPEDVPDIALALDTGMLRSDGITASPLLLQAEAQARSADAQVTVSKSQYFPSLQASYSQSWAGTQVGSLRNTWSARLSMSWPIFNGFTREANVSRAIAAQEAARARADDARRQVTAQLTQQFAALESARARAGIAAASRAAAEEDLRVQQERYRLGAATIVEVLAAQVNLDQAEVDLVQARLDFSLAMAEIEALVGRQI